MTFGQAMDKARLGYRINRKSWLSHQTYVEMASCITYKDVEGNAVSCDHSILGTHAFVLVSPRGVLMGWTPSQEDMLAEDWNYILEE